jgi:hypothetical protein
MAVTVEIKTGQRRVIEYLLSPLLKSEGTIRVYLVYLVYLVCLVERIKPDEPERRAS